MGWVRRSLAVLAITLGLFVVGESLSIALGPLSKSDALTKAPEPARQIPQRAAGPCFKSFAAEASGREVALRVYPSRVDLTFTLWLPKASPCAAYALQGGLADITPEYLNAAFGEIKINGELLAADVGNPRFLQPLKSENLKIMVRARRSHRGRLQIGLKRRSPAPQFDRISMTWEKGIRVESVSPPVEVLGHQKALIEASALNGSFWADFVSTIPIDSSPVLRSTQELLRNLDRLLDLRTPLSYGFVVITPLLLFLHFAVPSRTHRTLITGTQSLVILHLTLFVLVSLTDLGGYWLKDGSEALSRYAEARLCLPWQENAGALRGWGLGEGMRYVGPIVLGLLLPAVVRRRLGPELSPAAPWVRLAVGGMILGALAAGAKAILLFNQGGPSTPVWAYVLLSAVVGLFLLWFLLARLGRHLLPGALLPLGLAPTAALVILSGMVVDRLVVGPPFLRSAYWLLITVVLGSRLVGAALDLVRHFGHGVPLMERLSHASRTHLGRLLIAALVIPAMPLVRPNGPIADNYNLFSLGFAIDPFLVLLWVVGVLAFLWRKGGRGMELAAFTRMAGLLAIATVLFNTGSWLLLPVTFLLGWMSLHLVLVRPAEDWKRMAAVRSTVARIRPKLIASVLRVNAAERGYRGFRQQQIKKMEGGDLAFSDYEKSLTAREEEIAGVRRKALSEHGPASEVAFSIPPYSTAWRNGLHGARRALLFAAPWIVLGLAELLRGAAPQTPYPLWWAAYQVTFTLLKWTVYGFLLGYFYPYIRGESGLEKGFYIFLAATLPVLPLAAIYNSSQEGWQAMLFWFLQTFIHCMLLGLFAFDYAILKKSGHRDWRLLFEVHGIPAVGVSISSILLAVGTAVTTLLTTQATGLVGLALRFALPETFSVAPH
jgi:hypothetical protein